MSKNRPVTEAQRAAMRKYDAKRAALRLSVRLSEDDAAALDIARGEESRSAYVLRILRKAIGRRRDV